jgi:hypothetical protein
LVSACSAFLAFTQSHSFAHERILASARIAILAPHHTKLCMQDNVTALESCSADNVLVKSYSKSTSESAIEFQATDHVTGNFNQDLVKSSSIVNSVSPIPVSVSAPADSISNSDSVSAPKKRCRGRDRSKKANQRRWTRQRAARDVASRAIVRVSELHAEVQEARLQAGHSRALLRSERESTERERKLRLDLGIELVKTRAELRESQQACSSADGSARQFQEKFEIQTAVAVSTTLSLACEKLLRLPDPNLP